MGETAKREQLTRHLRYVATAIDRCGFTPKTHRLTIRQFLARIFGRHWRDAWQLEHVARQVVIISEQPMTEEEWIKARAIDVTPKEEADVTLPVTRKKDDV